VKYDIKVDKKAAKALAKMPRKVQTQVKRKIDALAQNPFPRGCRLIETTEDIYRITSGNYRISYTVKKKRLIILVIRIGHRQDFYTYFRK